MKILDAMEQLRIISQTHERVLVSFSGGKDSSVILHMAKRVFKHVEAFFMYFIPEQPGIERVQRIAEEYNVTLHLIQHWCYFRAKAEGAYCKPEGITRKLDDSYGEIRMETGIKPILHGGRRQDGQWRQMYTRNKQWEEIYFPLWELNIYEVESYCRSAGIEMPESESRRASGVDLADRYLLWAYENDRETYDEIQMYFPFIGASIKKQEWYGGFS